VREYEFTFIVQPEITEEGLQGVCDRYDALLEKHGAIRLHYDDWGRRRLAYEIQKFQKGHYLILHFLDDGKVVPELERVSKIDDSILRFLTVLASESVEDIEARKQEAARLEEERKRKAAERAARDATDEAGAAENDEAAGEPEVAAEETNAEDVEPAETDADEEEEK
jgi:small subunit ribosomal protein S6